ncbi:hypothetical protein [uncultured Mediterranean phage uvMED]|nr:hypothetical protein [uncultured Mediterranean phage uvMED]BAQ92156.1 hypothetical protein [uncultured Mediterranean phage uvMED]
MLIKDDDLHADNQMTTTDFHNLNLYGKKRLHRPRIRDKKFKSIFSEIKTIEEKK